MWAWYRSAAISRSTSSEFDRKLLAIEYSRAGSLRSIGTNSRGGDALDREVADQIQQVAATGVGLQFLVGLGVHEVLQAVVENVAACLSNCLLKSVIS